MCGTIVDVVRDRWFERALLWLRLLIRPVTCGVWGCESRATRQVDLGLLEADTQGGDLLEVHERRLRYVKMYFCKFHVNALFFPPEISIPKDGLEEALARRQ